MFFKMFKKYVSSLAVLSVLTTQYAIAQSPYRAEIAGDRSALHSLASELNDGVVRIASPIRSQASSSIRLSLRAPGLGRLKVVLNEVQHKSWESYFVNSLGIKERDPKDVILVSGIMQDSSGKKRAVGGSLYNVSGRPRLHLIVGSNRNGSRSYSIKAKLGKDGASLSARVSSVPVSAQRTLGCGVEEEHDHSHHQAAGLVRAAGSTSGNAVIATDADPEFYAVYGASTNAQIATLVNAASAIYENDLGIKFVLGSQHAFTSSSGNPYTSSDANTLLTSFLNYTSTNGHLGVADVYHMFSGKDFAGSTIGLAYVGVVCQYPDYAFGITQKFHDSADASILAHELGHNFGAGHDNTDPSSLMAPYVSVPGSTYFSAASKSAIQSHLSGSPTCLDAYTGDAPGSGGGGGGGGSDPSDPEDPESATIQVKASLNKKSNTLKIRTEATQLGCTVSLYMGTKRSKVETLLVSTVQGSSTLTYTVAGLADPKQKSSKLYFDATLDCSGTVYESEISGVNLDSLSRKTSKTINQVAKAIKKAFGSSASSRNKRIR